MKPIIYNHLTENMNKLESKYSERLQMLKAGKLIIDFSYEAVKLRLADKTFYTPDFFVVFEDRFEFHEVKGFLREDANVKFKVAKKLYPWFTFYMVFWEKKRGWVFR